MTGEQTLGADAGFKYRKLFRAGNNAIYTPLSSLSVFH